MRSRYCIISLAYGKVHDYLSMLRRDAHRRCKHRRTACPPGEKEGFRIIRGSEKRFEQAKGASRTDICAGNVVDERPRTAFGGEIQRGSQTRRYRFGYAV